MSTPVYALVLLVVDCALVKLKATGLIATSVVGVLVAVTFMIDPVVNDVSDSEKMLPVAVVDVSELVPDVWL